MSKTVKPLPVLRGDAEAERFVAEADLADYDLSAMKPMRFELRRKEKQLNLRVSAELLDAFRRAAEKQGVPYQRLIRELMEKAVRDTAS